VPTRRGALSRPHLVALLLLSILDRGVSEVLLEGIGPRLGEEVDLGCRVADLWPAIWDIAQRDQVPDHSGVSGATLPAAPDTSAAPLGSTLVKRVSAIDGGVAYKLHDYIGLLLQGYLGRWLQLPASEVANSLFRTEVYTLLSQRAQVLRATLAYIERLAHHNRPRAGIRLEGEQLQQLRLYQMACATRLYYTLRLAAMLYSDEIRAGRPSDPVGPLCLPQANPSEFHSRHLRECLAASSGAAAVATGAFSYLYGKVLRSVNEYFEYGFAAMLLQEVRPYLSLQDAAGGQPPVTNSGLPLAEGDPAFTDARQLYYAALLTWEMTSGQYPLAEPWLGQAVQDIAELPPRRAPADWLAETVL
jgi:hypothetical protein